MIVDWIDGVSESVPRDLNVLDRRGRYSARFANTRRTRLHEESSVTTPLAVVAPVTRHIVHLNDRSTSTPTLKFDNGRAFSTMSWTKLS
jgi:hypothetical protein